MRNGVIWLAVAVYGIALFFTFTGGGAARSTTAAELNNSSAEHVAAPFRSQDGLPYRCIGIQLQRVDWMDKYKQSIDEIVAVGADTVKFVVDARQENGQSARIWLDMRNTPTQEQLGDLIKYAKSKGLRVILMPIVLLDQPVGNEWRGKIEPNPDFGGWNDWWTSYREMLRFYADASEAYGADMLVVGSELVSTEDQLDQWYRTIDDVRKVYKGRLTYSSNWDHYTAVKFWDRLDMIGMNSYWKMGPDENVTVDEIRSKWKEIQSDLLPFVKKTGKPLMFLEIGWFSQRNAAREPWDYTKPLSEEPIDLDLQKRLYEAFFRSWHGNELLGGYSIWEWTPGNGGPEDPGYTPENKPAQNVLKEWMNKPAWKVK